MRSFVICSHHHILFEQSNQDKIAVACSYMDDLRNTNKTDFRDRSIDERTIFRGVSKK
jgi:hypothetical protein